MTANIAALREAIAFSRENPDLYNQGTFGYSSENDLACVIGRARIQSGRYLTAVSLFAKDFLGLSDIDYDYISNSYRTLDEIEQRVDEIAAREATREVLVFPVEKVTVKVDGFEFDVLPADLKGFVDGLRALNPDRRIVKLTEEVL